MEVRVLSSAPILKEVMMITKRQYCMHILDKFAKMESKPIEQVQEDDILKSSSLAVAMEYLDLLKTPTFAIPLS